MNNIPASSDRVSTLMMRERLVRQVQADQVALARVQDQVSTGRRISAPSDDVTSAFRAMTLQRLLERKDQIATNVDRGLSYLAATDASLNGASSLLGDMRGAALGVAGTTATQEQRNAVADEVERTLETLLQTANRSFRGRYLFAGSQTNRVPYAMDGDYVVYRGNEKSLRNHSDFNVLFASNAPGQDVFGGISSQKLGGVDLNPQASPDTLLASLNGGLGVSAQGAVTLSDGSQSVVVDLSRAATLGDVARLLEAHAPPGRQLDVRINGRGLELQLDAAGGGNLTVTEVGSGQTARELGIFDPVGVSTGPLLGADLNPQLAKTVPLSDLLGVKARGSLASPGANNDIALEAAANGAAFNGTRVQFVDSAKLSAASAVAPGSEYAQYDGSPRAARGSLRFSGSGDDLVLTAAAAGAAFNNVRINVTGAPGAAAAASYDAAAKVLTLSIDSLGGTTVEALRLAIDAEGTFTAAGDSSAEPYNPAALLDGGDIGNAQGDTANSGGAAGTLYVYVAPGATTANHAVAAINAEGSFRARLDAADTTSVPLAGTGVVDVASFGTLAGGSGQAIDLASGLRVTNGGETFALDFSQAETVEDLLNVLNGEESSLLAEINADGRSIDVRSRISGGTFQIGENGGSLASQLGLRTTTAATKLAELNDGVGVPDRAGNDFRLVVDDGAGGTIELAVDIAGAVDIQDVLDRINDHPLNDGVAVDLEARLASVGNGIVIEDRFGRPLVLRNEFGSQAAEYLGLLPAGATEVAAPGGAVVGQDRNYLRTESVFTSLVRLRDALRAGDVPALERSIAMVDDDIVRINFARAEVGARQQGLEISRASLADEDIQLQAALSEEIDVDLVQALSELTTRQAALQASLKTTANVLQLSLLDFL
jgi:flagellin-like hook-associated protein FlgL